MELLVELDVAIPDGTSPFTGPAINGRRLPGASADWQTGLPDGTAIGDVRYPLQTPASYQPF
jgi:hypothetical protein